MRWLIKKDKVAAATVETAARSFAGSRSSAVSGSRPVASSCASVARRSCPAWAWAAAAIRNVAAMGYFSSDRAIREYAELVWDLKPVAVRDNG